MSRRARTNEKHVDSEILEKIEEEIKQLEKLPWFLPKPELTSARNRALLNVLKGLDGVIKFALFYLRRVGEHFGIFVDYEIGRMLDKDGKPVVYIKLHGIHFFNEISTDSLEDQFEAEGSQEKNVQSIFDEVDRSRIGIINNKTGNKQQEGESANTR